MYRSIMKFSSSEMSNDVAASILKQPQAPIIGNGDLFGALSISLGLVRSVKCGEGVYYDRLCDLVCNVQEQGNFESCVVHLHAIFKHLRCLSIQGFGGSSTWFVNILFQMVFILI